MSIISKLKNLVRKNAKVVGVTAAVIAAAGIGATTLGHSFADSPVSTPDCTANSVIWCGAANPAALDTVYHKDGGDGHHTSANIQTIYGWFGINGSDIDGMTSDSVNGYITKSGDVYADGKLVATNALSAGREDIDGSASTEHDVNGVIFWTRPPSVSFLDDELSAMVVMKNGVFQFAIMNSCGNPVKATPVPAPKPAPKPALVCSELDDTPGTVESNGDQSYSFEAKASATNGAKISSYAFNFGDGASQTVSTSNASASVSHTFTPGTWKITVTVNGSSLQSSCSKSITINKPTPPPAPKPALVCSELDDTPGTVESNGDQSYSFTAKATPTNGATISSYAFDYGDGATQTVNTSTTSTSVSHNYAPGTWTAKVTVNGSNNLQSSCTKTVTIPPVVTPPPAGSLVCSNLDLESGTTSANGSEEFTLNATAATTNGATISSYTFNLGGSNGTKTVTTSADTATTTYTYPAGTNVTVSVTVTGMVNGKSFTTAVSPNCSKQVTVPAQQASSIVCEDLAYSAGTAASNGDIPYTFTVDAVPTNATVDSYVFSFAPNSPQTTNAATNSYAPGANVSVNVTVNGTLANGSKVQVTSANCAVQFTVPSTPTCTSVSGQTYPEGSSQCETCTSPSGQTYQMGSSECTPPTTPTTPSTPSTPSTPLPNTGPGDVVGLFSGVSMSGAGLHRIIGNRRRARRAATRG